MHLRSSAPSPPCAFVEWLNEWILVVRFARSPLPVKDMLLLIAFWSLNYRFSSLTINPKSTVARHPSGTGVCVSSSAAALTQCIYLAIRLFSAVLGRWLLLFFVLAAAKMKNRRTLMGGTHSRAKVSRRRTEWGRATLDCTSPRMFNCFSGERERERRGGVVSLIYNSVTRESDFKVFDEEFGR